VGGCVENNLLKVLPEKAFRGSEINNELTAGFTFMGTFENLSIFSSAEAKAKGLPEISAPVLSAPNSLVRDIAILMIKDAIGAAIKAMTMKAG
jgi:hypothetical protein